MAFKTEFKDGIGELEISDQLDTPIRDISVLKFAIEVFAKSGCFYLKVKFNQAETELITSEVTSIYLVFIFPYNLYIIWFSHFSQIIKQYLIQNEAQQILNEQDKNSALSEDFRKKLIKHLCEFLYSKFGAYPGMEQKKNVSKAAIKLFPGLKFKHSQADGIVCVFRFG